MSAPRSALILFPALLASAPVCAAGYTGDLGLGIYSRQGIYHGESNQTSVLPYVYGEWGNFFGRVDTFGYRIMPMGHGFLEASVRVSQDKMESSTLRDAGVRVRNDSRLVGVSTFQQTPIGAVSLALLQDVGDSEGMVGDASWIGRFAVASWLTVYPEIGLEVLTKKYTDYYFGVNDGEGGYRSYKPGTALNPYFAIHTATPLGGNWNLAFTVRNKALDDEIGRSPIVDRTGRWNAYVAVSYEFK